MRFGSLNFNIKKFHSDAESGHWAEHEPGWYGENPPIIGATANCEVGCNINTAISLFL